MNEIVWYVQHGDIHWDDSKLFTVNGILYQGGVWIKKLSVIAADHGKSVSALKSTVPDGGSYSYSADNSSYDSHLRFHGPAPITGEPANTNDYFFIYSLGQGIGTTYLDNSTPGEYIELWGRDYFTSSENLTIPSNRYMIHIYKTIVFSQNAVSKWTVNKWPNER